MSAELYADPTVPGEVPAPLAPVASPAVDILPSTGARKGRHPEPEPEPAVPFDLVAPHEPAAVPVNPWTGTVLPTPDAPPAPPAPVAPPAPSVLAAPEQPAAPADGEALSAKRFLGMQLRRPRRTEDPADQATQPQTEAAPEMTVAAWPTDVGVPVVADAEPVHHGWGGPPPFAYSAVDAVDAADAPHAVDEAPADELPVEAPEAPAAEAPVDVAVVPVPVPAPQPADGELAAVRTLLEASEARRMAAEQRGDQAVAYGQQLQAELTRVREDLEGRLRAAETRARTAANDAQDWQIRHREAETQVEELAQSVSGAEQRLADLRIERDDLLASLEEATKPASAMAQPGQPD